MKEQFIRLFKENIKREGSDKLLEYLLNSDFFTAPASGRFHCNYEGGLCEHSVNVYNKLLELVKVQYGGQWQKKFTAETIAVCGLLHDICKIDYYVLEYRNVKVEGEWVQKSFYSIKDKLPYGHGEKSVYMLSAFIKLTRDEALAINWHMGGFDERVKGGSYSLSEAFGGYPLCSLMHSADLLSTYIDEKRTN